MLVNHHAMDRNRGVFFAPLTQAVVDNEGILRLVWWKGNEKLKHEPIVVKLPKIISPDSMVMMDNVFDTRQGLVLEGKLRLPDAKDTKLHGLYIEHGNSIGTAILVDSNGVCEIGSIQADGSNFKREGRTNRDARIGYPTHFRLLLKQSLLEFYLDDLLMHCHSLPQNATGRIGIFHDSNQHIVSSLKAWR